MSNDICVYVDVLYVENLCIDYVILYLTAKIINKQQSINPLRILGGAAIGAIYAVFVTIVPVLSEYIILSFILKILASVIMCMASFRLKNVREFIIAVFGVYLFSFLFAGIFMALISMGLPASVASGGTLIVWGSVPILYLIEAIIFGYILISIVLFLVKTHKNISKSIEMLYICFLEKETSVSALVDTGNELCDPLNKLPVIICEANSIKSILPYEVAKASADKTDMSEAFMKENIWERYTIVPYNSVGVQDGMMYGFVSDYVYIDKNNKKKAVVCFAENKLSASNEYNAIMPYGILQQENMNNKECINTGGENNECSNFKAADISVYT